MRTAQHAAVILAISVSIAVLMMVLSGFPPTSLIYDWLERNHVSQLWIGATAGLIGLAVAFYIKKLKK